MDCRPGGPGHLLRDINLTGASNFGHLTLARLVSIRACALTDLQVRHLRHNPSLCLAEHQVNVALIANDNSERETILLIDREG